MRNKKYYFSLFLWFINMEEKIKSNKDLTEGVVWKKLILFFFPIALGTIIQQLYNTVDGLIVSKFVGTVALAAVGGSSAQIINLLIGIFVAVTAGASVVIAQLYGAKQYDDTKKAIGTSILISIIVGVILGFVGILIARPMLILFKTPSDTIEDSLTYLKIYFLGVPFVVGINMESNALRSVGDSKNPFIYMLISCITNIILDSLFVIVFHLDVAGVAIATVIAQVINFVLLTYKLFSTKNIYRIGLKDLKIRNRHFGSMIKFGIPNGVQSLMYSISNTIVQVAVNKLGTIGVASWNMTSKVDGIFWAISSALGVAITSFIGQNVGAKKEERVTTCVKQGSIIGFSLTIFTSLCIMIVSKPLLHVFTDDLEVQKLTYEMLWYFVPFYFTWTLIELLSAVLRGAGDVIRPVIILGLCICLFRVIWIYTVHAYFNTVASLCLVYISSWAFTSIVLYLYYKFSNWKDRSSLAKASL